VVAKKHKTVQNYAQLAQATLGNKARIAVNIILAINLIGTLIGKFFEKLKLNSLYPCDQYVFHESDRVGGC
jgi:hypothetical protein